MVICCGYLLYLRWYIVNRLPISLSFLLNLLHWSMKKVLLYILKYLTLYFLSFLLFNSVIKFSDYNTTVYVIFFVPFLLFLLIINLIVLYSKDYSRGRKQGTTNYRTTNYTVGSIILFFIITYPLSVWYNDNGAVTFIKVVNHNEHVMLVLYENNRFEISEQHPHTSSHYFGNYTLQNDSLHLLRDDVTTISRNLITNHYHYNTKQKRFIPTSDSFSELIDTEEIYSNPE